MKHTLNLLTTLLLTFSYNAGAEDYIWTGTLVTSYHKDENGMDQAIENPAINISPRTSHLELGDNGGLAEVIEESTSKDIFDALGLSPYSQQGGTCIGHSFGVILDYELMLNGFSGPGSRVVDQQLYTHLLAQRFDEIYNVENPVVELNFPTEGVLLSSVMVPYKVADGSYTRSRGEISLSNGGSSVEGFLEILNNFPKVCRLSVEETEGLSAESLLSDFTELTPRNLNPEYVRQLIGPYLQEQGKTEDEILAKASSFKEDFKNPFSYINELLFPSCLEEENHVDLSALLSNLYTVERGSELLRNNGAFEDFLKGHFNNTSARPVMVSICESFRDDFFLNRSPEISIGRETITTTYQPELTSAYPWATFGRSQYTPNNVEVSACGESKIHHAFVIKGKRKLALPNGTQRTDYLIEDSSRWPNRGFMWAGAGDYHFWLDSKTLVENTLSVSFFTDRD